MEIVIARSKSQPSLVLNHYPYVTLDSIESFSHVNPNSSRGFVDVSWYKDDLHTINVSRINFFDAYNVYHFLRKVYRFNVCSKWRYNKDFNYLQKIIDKLYQKDFWERLGSEISVEVWDVNFQTRLLTLKSSNDLKKYYPKRISHIS